MILFYNDPYRIIRLSPPTITLFPSKLCTYSSNSNGAFGFSFFCSNISRLIILILSNSLLDSAKHSLSDGDSHFLIVIMLSFIFAYNDIILLLLSNFYLIPRNIFLVTTTLSSIPFKPCFFL